MTELVHDLPEGMIEWVAEVGQGEVTHIHRHVARREAWVVDVTRPDGTVVEGFLRLQRGMGHDKDVDPRRLERETRIIQALAPTGVPVPEVYGWNPELRATLFERDPGRADIDKLQDPVRQRAIMEDFIRVVAILHGLDLEALGLDDIMPYKPTNASECALNELDFVLAQWRQFLDDYSDPLISYGVNWLRRFVPESVARVSLVQGDTGPVNFMFQGNKVSSVIDWELGHYGDPMEDLGNISVREMWNPCGGLDGLFELYQKESGIPYTRFGAQYYRVQQNVRGMVPIHAVCADAHPRESVAWYLCYRYLADRATCEALADAMGVEVDTPEMPESMGEADVVAEAAIYAQEHDVASKLTDPFAVSRANDVKTLIQCMDRKRRYGDAIESAELDDLVEIVGRRPASLSDGFRAFDEVIKTGRFDDEVVIRYLLRRAYREEWLYLPAVNLYPERRWADLD
ncbi:MAG: phosphotransferase family protein [Halieaceae bacterium]|jgi:aminoglycoside phosphotransferase (APT) family kinase protein|nr:phosphotransferase family protein [Halieaceae bacterium]